ncbi:hypothetical protein D3C73_1232290 [compost metagenome]
MVALNVVLVHTEIVQVNEKAIKQYHPKRRSDKIGFETTQTKFIGRFSNVYNFSYPAWHIADDQIKDEQRAKCFHNGLYYFCPYYRFNSS